MKLRVQTSDVHLQSSVTNASARRLVLQLSLIVLGFLALLPANGIAADFLSFDREAERVSVEITCPKPKITPAEAGLGRLFGCIMGRAETAKFFINEQAGTGRVESIKVIWNDWSKDLGYGLHADRAEAEKMLSALATLYAPDLKGELQGVFRSEKTRVLKVDGYEFAYSFRRGPAIDERLVQVRPDPKHNVPQAKPNDKATANYAYLPPSRTAIATPFAATLDKIKLAARPEETRFGVLSLSGTISNENSQWIKDISITCELFARSGTKIGHISQVLYERIPPQVTYDFGELKMGLVHSQAARYDCTVSNFVSDQVAKMFSAIPEARPLTKEQVRRLQDALRSRRFYDGTVDGTWNADTQDAVAKFQSETNMTATGVPADDVLRHLGVLK